MSPSHVVSNPSADANEKIARAVELVHSSRQCLEVFNAVYRGAKQVKSMDDIKKELTNFSTKTYRAARTLFSNDIIGQERDGKNKLYRKIGFYTQHKDQILRLVRNPKRFNKFPTKRKAQVHVVSGHTARFSGKPRVKQLYVDDIETFERVRAVGAGNSSRVSEMPERRINKAICRVLNQRDKADWGGERNDIYSNRIRISGGRRTAAFALKGRAVRTRLTPAKMGKNCDQIIRLFEATADLYVVGHVREVDERVVDAMHAHAIAKSVMNNNKLIQYCIIDGDDMARLVAAYPKEFGK